MRVPLAGWVTDWLTGLTNWLSTFDCLHRIDLCMWIRYFAAVGSICLLFLIYYLVRRIETTSLHWKKNVAKSKIKCTSIFISIQYFSIRYFNIICNRIESIRSACTYTNNGTLTGGGGIGRRECNNDTPRERHIKKSSSENENENKHHSCTVIECISIVNFEAHTHTQSDSEREREQSEFFGHDISFQHRASIRYFVHASKHSLTHSLIRSMPSDKKSNVMNVMVIDWLGLQSIKMKTNSEYSRSYSIVLSLSLSLSAISIIPRRNLCAM